MAAKYLKSLSKSEMAAFIESFDVVLSDCDGAWYITVRLYGCISREVKSRDLFPAGSRIGTFPSGSVDYSRSSRDFANIYIYRN